MENGAYTTVTRWLLLCMLFLGVVGMHHVAMGDDTLSGHGATHAASPHQQAPEEPAPTPPHDLLHMCVAVLGAAGSLLLLAWLLLSFVAPGFGRTPSTSAWPRAPDHPPPLGGRDLLSSVCVLRL